MSCGEEDFPRQGDPKRSAETSAEGSRKLPEWGAGKRGGQRGWQEPVHGGPRVPWKGVILHPVGSMEPLKALSGQWCDYVLGCSL